ncbi:MAG: RES domain-containing protein [Salinarimonadaceae bacterium]|nr:MAG: RES domain-containing protein [Salinarimonadaceae bacterium]
MTPPLTHLQQNQTIRLIANANHKPPVLEGLVQSYGARTKLEQLESVTSGRLQAQQEGVPGIAAQELAAGVYGYNYINAAFAYPRLKGSRFNPAGWGAWYCAFAIETALEEVAFHLTRELANIGEFDNETRYVELLADFDAEFADLRGLAPPPACLDPDAAVGYPAGQKLAEELRRAGLNGVVYPSVRHAGGTCLAAFWPALIRNFRQGATWKLTWAGEPRPDIRRV